MANVTVTCSRCNATVEGMRDEYFTGGFYDVTEGTPWHKFGRAGETDVCDPCMWADPEYGKVYPNDAQQQLWIEEQHGSL